VQATFAELRRARHVVAVKGVAAVNHDVVVIQYWMSSFNVSW